MDGRSLSWADGLALYWLARRREFSVHTEADYETTFGRFAVYVGERRLGEISAQDVHGFLNDVERRFKVGRKTLSNHWTALSSFFSWAESGLGLPHVMRGQVARPRYRRRTIRAYTAEEVRLLLAACDFAREWETPTGKMTAAIRPSALRDRAMLVTLVDTGLRCSELCGLDVSDYDVRRGELLVRHGKGDKSRVVYLGQGARQAVDLYLAERGSMGWRAPVFVTREGGRMDRNGLRRLVVRLAERARVAGANVHRFRHTFAINFLRNGGNVFALQSLLGHESIETIRLYVRLAQEDLARVQLAASPADHWALVEHGSHP